MVWVEGGVGEDRDRDEDEHQQEEALPGVIEELVTKVLVPCQLVASNGGEDDGQDEANRTTYHGSSFPKGKVNKLGSFPSKAISPWKEQQGDNQLELINTVLLLRNGKEALVFLYKCWLQLSVFSVRGALLTGSLATQPYKQRCNQYRPPKTSLNR